MKKITYFDDEGGDANSLLKLIKETKNKIWLVCSIRELIELLLSNQLILGQDRKQNNIILYEKILNGIRGGLMGDCNIKGDCVIEFNRTKFNKLNNKFIVPIPTNDFMVKHPNICKDIGFEGSLEEFKLNNFLEDESKNWDQKKIEEEYMKWWEKDLFINCDYDKPIIYGKKIKITSDMILNIFINQKIKNWPALWQVKMKTHKVIDTAYTEDEGQNCFIGTKDECKKFVFEQNTIGLKIVPLLKNEIILVN